MHSFKQYLLEEQNYRFELNYIFEYSKNEWQMTRKKDFEDKFREFIKENSDFASSYISIDLAFSTKCMIRLGQVSRSKMSNDKIEGLKTIYSKFLEDAGSEIIKVSSGVELTDLPSEPIKANRIKMTFLRDASLKGIEKNLIADVSIDLLNLKMITGGVLSILKIKNPSIYIGYDHVNSTNTSEWTSKWIEILKDHLYGDKNILACQEELIDNGFKDYAEL